MKRLLHSMLIAASLILVGCIKDDRETPEDTTLVKIGQVAPDFTAQLYPDGEVKLSSLRGNVVLLTLWDPGCETCQKEIAVVQERIIDYFQGEEFRYLPIARDQDYNAIESFCQEKGYTFPIGIDPERKIYHLYATKYVPRSFIIDREGVIRTIDVEYELDNLDTIVKTIEKML